MASIMSKRGQQDNVVTFEHICDYIEDMDSIDKRYATLGSVAIILHPVLSVYMADSEGEWCSLMGGSSESTSAPLG